MINKIKNWTKNHRYIAGAGLLMMSICAIAFGFAQFGPQNNPDYIEDDIFIPEENSEEIMETDEY